MSIEYWLQKKTIGGWSHVTWYAEYQEAKANFATASVGNSGYSWRIVEAKTIEEKLLDEVVEVPKPVTMDLEPVKDKNSPWGATSTPTWGEKLTSFNPSPDTPPSVPDGRGAKLGSVWLVHHDKKHKTRVAASEVDAMIAQGYERGGPATAFREGVNKW